MPNKSYQKGYRFEVRIKKHLESQGWIVFRSAKSRFPDLVCVKHGKIKFCECKWNKYLSREEKAKATRLIEHAPFFVYWNNNRKIDMYEFTVSDKELRWCKTCMHMTIHKRTVLPLSVHFECTECKTES